MELLLIFVIFRIYFIKDFGCEENIRFVTEFHN